jgi:hypothetical protein
MLGPSLSRSGRMVMPQKSSYSAFEHEMVIMCGQTRARSKFSGNIFHNMIGTTMGWLTTLNWLELNLSQLPEHHHLDDHFTEAKIKRAIMELPTEKAPGLMILLECFIDLVGYH